MQSFHACIRHYSPRRQGGSRRTVLAHITGISPLRGSLRAAPIAWSRYHPGLWLDRSIITGLLTRVGLGKPAAMRNSPPQAALWPDGHRSAPFLAVFDADSRPAQVVLAHPPASLQPSSRRASRQRTYPAAGYEVLKVQAGGFEEPPHSIKAIEQGGSQENFYFSAKSFFSAFSAFSSL